MGYSIPFSAKHSFLVQEGHETLLLVLAGWTVVAGHFSHLTSEKADVLVFYDYGYNDVPPPDLSMYSNIYLIGYSMGVMEADLFLAENPSLPLRACLAINGTPFAISDKFGIPLENYHHLIDNMSSSLFKEFVFALCGNILNYRRYAPHLPLFNGEVLRSQLLHFQTLQTLSTDNVPWSHAMVSIHDQVFPYKNMVDYWSGQRCIILSLEDTHFPFYRWNQWDQIIALLKTETHD